MNVLEAFRRDRGLLAADDLVAWLAAAGLGADDWADRVLAGDTAGLPAVRPARRDRPLPTTPWSASGADMPPQVWMDRPAGCGEAALCVVLQVLRPASGARPALPADASLTDIVTAAREAGLAATPVKASRHRIARLPTPWIAHVDDGHWIVVHRAGPDEAVVSDPALGAGSISAAALQARWSGWAAVFGAPVHCE